MNFFWSLLDFINVLFYVAGTWFVVNVALPGKGTWVRALPLIALAVPAFWITGIGNSITGFNQPVCEAFGSDWLASYKLVVEIVCAIIALAATAVGVAKAASRERRSEVLLVGLPIVAFLVIFGLTEYYSSSSGIYEVNLYALFTAPILFAPVVYSMLRYQLSAFATVGVRLLAIVAVALVGVQFFFIQNTANYIINGVAFVLVSFFAVAIVSSIRREAALRARAEELAKNLEQANLRLLELDKQKSEFVSLASHQLRGPITAVKGYASMILEGDYGAVTREVAEVLRRIQTSAHDMAVLITDYLDVTRIELGRVKYTNERFSFRDLVQEVVRELAPNVPRDRVHLEVTLGEHPLEVFGDRNKVKQVVANFIDNGVKYTPHGDVSVKVSEQNRMAHFEVKDSGVGISPESLASLFHKFSRAKNASKMNIRGTGLGLYIAKTIVDHHHGAVSAQSAGEGQGSTFTVDLPLAPEKKA